VHKMVISTRTFMKMHVKFDLLSMRTNNSHIHSNTRQGHTLNLVLKYARSPQIYAWYTEPDHCELDHAESNQGLHHHVKSALFWDIMRHRVAICYWCFRTPC